MTNLLTSFLEAADAYGAPPDVIPGYWAEGIDEGVAADLTAQGWRYDSTMGRWIAPGGYSNTQEGFAQDIQATRARIYAPPVQPQQAPAPLNFGAPAAQDVQSQMEQFEVQAQQPFQAAGPLPTPAPYVPPPVIHPFGPPGAGTLNYGPEIGGSGWATGSGEGAGTNSTDWDAAVAQAQPPSGGSGPLGGLIGGVLERGADLIGAGARAAADIPIGVQGGPFGPANPYTIGEAASDVVGAYGSDIPIYSDVARDYLVPAAGYIGEKVGEYATPPLVDASLAAARGITGAPVPSGGQIGRFAGETVVPISAGDVALELLPGIGTVPGVLSWARRTGLIDDVGRVIADPAMLRRAAASLGTTSDRVMEVLTRLHQEELGIYRPGAGKENYYSIKGLPRNTVGAYDRAAARASAEASGPAGRLPKTTPLVREVAPDASEEMRFIGEGLSIDPERLGVPTRDELARMAAELNANPKGRTAEQGVLDAQDDLYRAMEQYDNPADVYNNLLNRAQRALETSTPRARARRAEAERLVNEMIDIGDDLSINFKPDVLRQAGERLTLSPQAAAPGPQTTTDMFGNEVQATTPTRAAAEPAEAFRGEQGGIQGGMLGGEGLGATRYQPAMGEVPTPAAAAPSPAAPAPARQSRKAAPKLPRDLAGAKENYNYRDKNFSLVFVDDVDRAAYIASRTTKSKRDADYVRFVTEATGLDEAGVRRYGSEVRDRIKAEAATRQSGTIRVKAGSPPAPAKAAAPPAAPAPAAARLERKAAKAAKPADAHPFAMNHILPRRPEEMVAREATLPTRTARDLPFQPTGSSEGEMEAFSRKVREAEITPPEVPRYPIGTYRRGFEWSDGRVEVEQLQRFRLDDPILNIPEKGFYKNQDVIDKYVRWVNEGSDPPPLTGVEVRRDDGTLRRVNITDGAHRAMAVEKARGTDGTVDVWVALTDPENTARPVYVHPAMTEDEVVAAAKAPTPPARAAAAGGAPPPPRPPGGPPVATAEPPPPPTPPPGGPKGEEFAGNIRLSKYPEDIGELIKDHVARNPESAEGARRGVIPDAEVEQMARDLVNDLGGDFNKLQSKWKIGDAWNAEEVSAIRGTLNDATRKVMDAAEAVRASDSTANKMALTEAILEQARIQQIVHGVTAEAGRALRAFKRNAQDAIADNDLARMQELMRRALGTKTDVDVDQLAEMIRALDDLDDPVKVHNFLRSINKPDFWDKLHYYWMNSILSGPITQARNILGNMGIAMYSPVQRAGAAAIEQPLAALQGRQAERFWQEVPASVAGLFQGLPEGVRGALTTMRTGISPRAAEKLEIRPQPIGGIAGDIIGMPVRMLGAMDELFSAVAERSSLNGNAVRMARIEGHKGQVLSDRIAALIDSPPRQLARQSHEQAEEMVLRGDPGEVAQAIAFLRRKVPGGRYILPFLNTPANLLKYGVENSPLGLLNLGAWQKAIKGNPEGADELSRAVMGSMVAASVATGVATGVLDITAAAPVDSAERDRFFREGKMPFSIKIPGIGWVEYKQIPMLDTTLTLVGSAVDGIRRGDDVSGIVSQAGVNIGTSLLDKSYMSGIADLFDAIQDPARYAERYVTRHLGGYVPFSGALRQTTGFVDRTLRDPEGFVETIESQIPGLSENVPPRLTAFGEEVRRGLPSPTMITPARQTAVDAALEAAGVEIGFVRDSIDGTTLSREQQALYQKAAGERTYTGIDVLISDPRWNEASDSEKAAGIVRQRDEARNAVRNAFSAVVDSKMYQSQTPENQQKMLTQVLKDMAEGWNPGEARPTAGGANYTPPPVRPRPPQPDELPPTDPRYYRTYTPGALNAQMAAQYGAQDLTMENAFGQEVPNPMRRIESTAMPQTQRVMAATYWEDAGFPNIGEVIRSVPFAEIEPDYPALGYAQWNMQRNTVGPTTTLGNPVIAAHEGLHSFYMSLSEADQNRLNTYTQQLLGERWGEESAAQLMESDPIHGINSLVEWTRGELPQWFQDFLRSLQPTRLGPQARRALEGVAP